MLGMLFNNAFIFWLDQSNYMKRQNQNNNQKCIIYLFSKTLIDVSFF